MINLQSAIMSANKLRESMPGLTNLSTVVSKASPVNQNTGAYDLIYPYLHQDFPTREEVKMFVDMSFQLHHSTNFHNGLKSTFGSTTIPPVAFKTGEYMNELVGAFVRTMTPVKSIGYGV